jgi:hypothetical protein
MVTALMTPLIPGAGPPPTSKASFPLLGLLCSTLCDVTEFGTTALVSSTKFAACILNASRRY